jgi:hypothetical protein
LDVCAAGIGSVGQGRDGWGGWALEEREYVCCRLAEVVVCGHFEEGDTVVEPINGKGAVDVTLVASVVVR